MKFLKTSLKDCLLIEFLPHRDSRGSFARTFCVKGFREQGIEFQVAQCNISVNQDKGTLRGLHYQIAPCEEAKVVWCFSGRAYDVVVDLRAGSHTYKKWMAVELSAEAGNALYIPKGFAHGFQTLLPDTQLFYWMSECYDETSARGIRWNDPAFQIEWPDYQAIKISKRDETHPNFEDI